MHAVMTNAVAVKMNCAGRGDKIRIADLKLLQFIICEHLFIHYMSIYLSCGIYNFMK